MADRTRRVSRSQAGDAKVADFFAALQSRRPDSPMTTLDLGLVLAYDDPDSEACSCPTCTSQDEERP